MLNEIIDTPVFPLKYPICRRLNSVDRLNLSRLLKIRMAIATPPKKEVHNVKSYFSGHYQTYDIKIQAVCDHNCHFLFIGVGGPGVMGDREAVKESGLSKLVEKLPGLLYCIGDCAYTPTEHLIPIYSAGNTTIT